MDEALTRRRLNGCRVAELKKLCRLMNLSPTGRKDELADRCFLSMQQLASEIGTGRGSVQPIYGAPSDAGDPALTRLQSYGKKLEELYREAQGAGTRVQSSQSSSGMQSMGFHFGNGQQQHQQHQQQQQYQQQHQQQPHHMQQQQHHPLQQLTGYMQSVGPNPWRATGPGGNVPVLNSQFGPRPGQYGGPRSGAAPQDLNPMYNSFLNSDRPFLQRSHTIHQQEVRSSRDNGGRPMQLRFQASKAQLEASSHRVYVFCVDTGDYGSGHKWPPNLELRVNGQQVPLVRHTKRTREQPALISKLLAGPSSGVAGNSSGMVGINELFVYHTGYIPYTLFVEAVRYTPPEQLAREIQDDRARVVSLEAGKQRIRDSFGSIGAGTSGDDQLLETHTKLLLTCPSTLMRVSVPAKGRACAHARCFDLLSFLIMNEQLPKWKCLVCDKPLPISDVVRDEFMGQVLSQTQPKDPDDIDEDPIECVLLRSDGTWTAEVEKERPDARPEIKAEALDDDLASSPPMKRARTGPLDVEDSRSTPLQNGVAAQHVAIPNGSGQPGHVVEQPEECALCKRTHSVNGGSLQRCSACRVTNYCGVSCQGADWDRHRNECADLKKQKEARKAELEEAERLRAEQHARGSTLTSMPPAADGLLPRIAPQASPLTLAAGHVSRAPTTTLAQTSPLPRKLGTSVHNAISLDSD